MATAPPTSGGLQFLSTPSARRATRDAYALLMFMQFLSTPSARRATAWEIAEELDITISIHALREEGDCCSPRGGDSGCYFYPRPPRGGRRRD